MQTKIRGVLKTRSAASAEEALAAFDGEAYPEFFTADIWEQAGKFLLCDAEFELAADCDPLHALRAIVALSADGVVECQLADDPVQRLHRSKKTKAVVGTSIPPAEFGAAIDDVLEDWKQPVEKARAVAAKKAAKAAKKAKAGSKLVDLGGAARSIIARSDGTFAAAVAGEVVVFDTDGNIGSRHPFRGPDEDTYAFRAAGLTELLDGRIAVVGSYSKEVRVLDLTSDTKIVVGFASEAHVDDVLPVPGGFVRVATPLSAWLGGEVVQLDTAGVDADFPSGAVRWKDRFVISCDKNLVYDADGKLLFQTQGGRATVVGDRLYTSWESRFGRTELDGTFSESSIPCNSFLLPLGEDIFCASGSAQRFDRAEEKVWSAPRIYDRANSGPPIALTDSIVVMTPSTYPPSARLLVVDAEKGEPMGEISGKGELESTLRVDEDTVVGLAHGAQRKKLHVFRDLRSKPRYEGLGGHEKPISGVAVLGKVVATWSEDGTTRLFDLG